MPPQAGQHSLKIGIDFGTTYSGVAWAYTANPDEINVISEWPSAGNTTTDKVPTELKYTDSGYTWGCELLLEPEKLVWFKLLLDPSQDSDFDELMVKSVTLMPPDKRPVDLVADFLSALKKHTLQKLEFSFGKSFMAITPIEYILTVPAVWSDAAKALTLEAAESVGLGDRDTLHLISEPEAAAVYSLKMIQPSNLKVGDTFVVVDCGGGTVDLISYEIAALVPRLKVNECVIGTGGMCGSTFLNRRFEAWVESRIGTDQFRRQRPRSRMHMMKYFEESLKRTFSDDENPDTFHCPVPGISDNQDAGVEDGFLAISRSEMRRIFDPIINQVVALVEGQIRSVEALRRKVSAVLLVGGFGASEYLRKRLDVLVCKKRKITLMQPVNAWTAVVSGACQRGLEGLSIVTTIRARRHYGIICWGRMSDEKYANVPVDRQFVCPWTGALLVKDCIWWYIKKGDVVSENKAISMPFVSDVAPNCNMIFDNNLLACSSDIAPEYSKHPDVFKVCALRTDLNSVPKDQFKVEHSSTGYSFFHIAYNITMKIEASLVFGFEFQGKQYSSIKAKFA